MYNHTNLSSIVSTLNKKELTNLIHMAQEMLSNLFNNNKISDNIKESRFSKGY